MNEICIRRHSQGTYKNVRLMKDGPRATTTTAATTLETTTTTTATSQST